MGVCRDCGHRQLTAFADCPECLSADIAAAAVSPSGSLYSFTVVNGGGAATPYALGYVDTSEGVRLLARLEPPFERFACDTVVMLSARNGTVCAEPAGDDNV